MSKNKVFSGETVAPDRAMRLVKCMATARFDETVDLALQLGVDPRKQGQQVRGVASLPHGTGKTVRVAVFARGPKAEEAKAAGADLVGAEDLVKSIQEGNLNFDRAIASPDVMPIVGRVARILGPRGLMPNPKLGSVTLDVASAVTEAKAGQVEFRVERSGIVHCPIGKVSFPTAQLVRNLRAVLVAVQDHKPTELKGTYMRAGSVSSSMGRAVHMDASTLDPSSGTFLQEQEARDRLAAGKIASEQARLAVEAQQAAAAAAAAAE